MSAEPQTWPDVDWRMPRIIPPPPAALWAPVLDRRPELADLEHDHVGLYLAQSVAWSA